MKAIYVILLLMLTLSLGLVLNYFSHNFTEVPLLASQETEPTKSREPSAIQKDYDFSLLNGSALLSATKERIVSGFNVIKENGLIGLELGHFVLKDSNGSKVFACEKYSNILLSFEGDGFAMGGDKPNMEVEGICEISEDINKISPLWIPIGKILDQAAEEREFSFQEKKTIKVRFKNISEEWPRNWILRSVKLIDPLIPGDELIVSTEEIKEFISQENTIFQF